MSVKKRNGDEKGPADHTNNYPFASATIFPCTFCALLEPDEKGPKYYVCTTRNFNETMARWANHGPEWTRMHKFTGQIIEIDPFGSYEKTKDMTLRYMIEMGPDNVRSSLPGHVVATKHPSFYTQHMKSCDDQKSFPP